ncbi:uncharacterized protein LOC123292718 [Chrysoperla carnea]|uniref:uncharacterized protein LOC123292718 n=1 Tax=Chrysoperla carnea TaxID=189513 RepID=UPI001D089B73|nr:uncharacterized protein LOC123292718 [Chrysoperla carnea]
MRLHILCYCCCICSSKWLFLILASLSASAKKHTIFTTIFIVLLFLFTCSSTTSANRNTKQLRTIKQYQEQKNQHFHSDNIDTLHHNKVSLEDKTNLNNINLLSYDNKSNSYSKNNPNRSRINNSDLKERVIDKNCKYIISGDNGLVLHINNINYKDAGHYQCAQVQEHSGKILVKGKRILLKIIDKPTTAAATNSHVSHRPLTTQTHRHTRNIVESSSTSLLSAKITSSSSEWASSSSSSSTSNNNDNRQQQFHLSSQQTQHEESSGEKSINNENIRDSDDIPTRRKDAEIDVEDDEDDIIEEPIALPQIQQNPHDGADNMDATLDEHDKNTNNPHKQQQQAVIGNKNEITYINQHEKLTLKCDVNINFTNNIWLKDGEVIDSIILTSTTSVHPGSGHRYTRDRAGKLYINNVRLEDNGQWQCEAEDAFGYVMTAKPIHLIVLEQPRKPYLLIDNRRLDPGNLFVPVKESTELDIQCIVEGGNPKPRLTWDLSIAPTPSTAIDGPDMSVQVLNLTVIDKDIIEVGNIEQRSNVDHNNGVISEAKLRVLRAHHNATISCLVHHMTLNNIPLQASLLLDVQYTPSFAISREPGFGIPVLEGMPVSLKCDVDANPTSQPMWEKDDGPPPVVQSLDGYLNFTAIRREHSGWYKCTARYLSQQFSSIGYFLNVRYETLDVTQEPEFDVSELSSTGKQLEVALGGAVHLQCPAGSHGCWSRVNAENGRLNPLGASQDLRLDKILYHEAGEYRCVAPGKDYKERMDSLRNALIVNLSVKGRPTVHPSLQNLTSPPGETQSIIVEFCANPVYKSALWITENKIFRPGFGDPLNNRIFAHDIINSTTPNCYQAKLTFMSIDYKDDGEYIFLVRSSSGLAEGIVYVSVLPTDNNEFNTNSAKSFNVIRKSSTPSLISSYIKLILTRSSIYEKDLTRSV